MPTKPYSITLYLIPWIPSIVCENSINPCLFFAFVSTDTIAEKKTKAKRIDRLT
jgi:hypothetical protein